ncbi:hypothetical protein Acor_03350 [Acrocarpospora corrugata]|uniref:Lipoprotein n=1 Tax=Acrocarpospora corrugata TaxID=35763 RepID=A0A5M3VP82_9ACTN|nr:hypothetical protein [Acrocarpospora corrugata]GER98273.1 hypothetical protein Acor_03350 [Acrocarpospora corrugata]
MRTLSLALPLTLLAAVLVAGCATPVTAPAQPRADLPKECSEVPILIGGKLSEFSALAEKPKELKASIAGAATEVAAKVAGIEDATIKEAVQTFADELKKIEVTDRASAVAATQTAIAGGTGSMEKVAKVCV